MNRSTQNRPPGILKSPQSSLNPYGHMDRIARSSHTEEPRSAHTVYREYLSPNPASGLPSPRTPRNASAELVNISPDSNGQRLTPRREHTSDSRHKSRSHSPVPPAQFPSSRDASPAPFSPRESRYDSNSPRFQHSNPWDEQLVPNANEVAQPTRSYNSNNTTTTPKKSSREKREELNVNYSSERLPSFEHDVQRHHRPRTESSNTSQKHAPVTSFDPPRTFPGSSMPTHELRFNVSTDILHGNIHSSAPDKISTPPHAALMIPRRSPSPAVPPSEWSRYESFHPSRNRARATTVTHEYLSETSAHIFPVNESPPIRRNFSSPTVAPVPREALDGGVDSYPTPSNWDAQEHFGQSDGSTDRGEHDSPPLVTAPPPSPARTRRHHRPITAEKPATRISPQLARNSPRSPYQVFSTEVERDIVPPKRMPLDTFTEQAAPRIKGFQTIARRNISVAQTSPNHLQRAGHAENSSRGNNASIQITPGHRSSSANRRHDFNDELSSAKLSPLPSPQPHQFAYYPDRPIERQDGTTPESPRPDADLAYVSRLSKRTQKSPVLRDPSPNPQKPRRKRAVSPYLKFSQGTSSDDEPQMPQMPHMTSLGPSGVKDRRKTPTDHLESARISPGIRLRRQPTPEPVPLANSNSNGKQNPYALRLDTSSPSRFAFRGHSTPDLPLEDEMMKRMSSLRLISASPDHEASAIGKPSTKSHENITRNSHQSDHAANANDPLFLTLTDALSQPYAHTLAGRHLERQSWNSAHDEDHNVWTPVEEPPEQDRCPSVEPDDAERQPKQSERARPRTARPSGELIPNPFPSIESDISSIVTDEHRLSNDGTSLSGAAEELFKRLNGSPGDVNSNIGPRVGQDPRSASRATDRAAPPSNANDMQRSARTINDSSQTQPSSWRMTLTEDTYQTLLARFDIFEMRRQEVIWELCESEDEFVNSMRIVLKLFVQPLRAENDTYWIPGLNPNVAKLFDWLDDITQLHSQILSTMRGCRANQLPIVTQIAESLRPFVPKLEVHQPYLARIDDTVQLIKQMLDDTRNDFGEFVRIQTSSPECPESLPNLLQKPVERLLKYPTYFKQLFGLTPRSHSDHLSMFSLLHSTDMMIRVLQTVKLRESEYSMIKLLSSRIRGLPSDYRLVSRDRKLIAQGPLLRINMPSQKFDPDGHLPHIDYTPGPPENFIGQRHQMFRPVVSSDIPRGQDLRSTLASARNEAHFSTSDDYSSFSSGPSASASTLPSSTGIDTPQSNQNYDFGHGTLSQMYEHRRSKTREGETHETPEPDGEWIYAFVFNDVVVLTLPAEMEKTRGLVRGRKTTDSWILLEGIGLSRVLGFSDLSSSGLGSKYGHLLALDLLPMGMDPTSPNESIATPVYVSLAERSTGRMALAPVNVLGEARLKWTEAFKRCYMYTLRSLAFPASYGASNSDIHKTDRQALPDPRSIMNVLSSDQPLPKSPSVLQNLDSNPIEQEREEREWWSTRFQQILKELTSRDEVEALPHPQPMNNEWESIDKELTDDLSSVESRPRPLSILKPNKSKLFKFKV